MVQKWLTDLITFGIFCVVVLLVYRGLLLVLKRFDKKKPGTASSVKVLRILLRFGVIFAIGISIFTFFDTASTLLVSLSSITGIIIGFASTEVITQIIAGIYLITARPFTVDDLVKIEDVEGLVIEINLDHTLIKQFDNSIMLIPNKKLLESQILNYTMNIKNELRTNQTVMNEKEYSEDTSIKKGLITRQKVSHLMGNLAEFVGEEYITQYVFEIEIDFEKNPKRILDQLDAICTQYSKVYYRKPRFKVVSFGYRAKTRFWVHAKKPQVIMENQNAFINSIAEKIYSEESK